MQRHTATRALCPGKWNNHARLMHTWEFHKVCKCTNKTKYLARILRISCKKEKRKRQQENLRVVLNKRCAPFTWAKAIQASAGTLKNLHYHQCICNCKKHTHATVCLCHTAAINYEGCSAVGRLWSCFSPWLHITASQPFVAFDDKSDEVIKKRLDKLEWQSNSSSNIARCTYVT